MFTRFTNERFLGSASAAHATDHLHVGWIGWSTVERTLEFGVPYMPTAKNHPRSQASKQNIVLPSNLCFQLAIAHVAFGMMVPRLLL